MACSICGGAGHNRRTCPDAGKVVSKKLPGGQPGNMNALKHGLYSSRFLPGEVKILEDFERMSVEHEIDMMRVVLGRVLEVLGTENELVEMASLVNALTNGAQRVGHLVRLQQALYGVEGGLEDALYDALRDVAEEMNIG